MKERKLYCKNCFRWYVTGADQCNIPCYLFKTDEDEDTAFIQAVYGSVEKAFKNYKKAKENDKFIRSKLSHFHYNNKNFVYGHPSELNIDNDCKFYKGFKFELPFGFKWLNGFIRFLYSAKY